MFDVKKIYDKRFTSFERVQKNELWKILCSDFLQKFVKKEDVIVDIGAGHCEFINNIKGKRKVAVDANKDVKNFANKDIVVIISEVKKIKQIFKPNSVDIIFMSNLLEHLNDKEEVFRLLLEANIVLKKNGRLLIMQPDIKRVGNAYWDYFDHKVPLTADSVTEALIANDFKIKTICSPFLPYTTKTKFLPLWPALLKIYLKIRVLQLIFGKQFFVCAQK